MSGENELQHSWCLWEHRKGGGANEYESQMTMLGEFKTVEGFWRFKNNIPNPSEAFFTSGGGQKKFDDREIDAFSMFKTNIQPMWEDTANANGGEFFCKIYLAPQLLDDLWEKLLLGCIGEIIDSRDEICGVRCVDKSRGPKAFYRLELWFRSNEPAIVDDLRNNMYSFLETDKYLKEYQDHRAALTSHGSGSRRGGSGRSFK